MHELRRPPTLQSPEPRLAFRKVEIPVLDQVCSGVTVLQPLPVIRQQLDIPLPADVSQVLAYRRHRIGAGRQYLDYDFRRADDGARNLLNLCRRRVVTPPWAASTPAYQIKERSFRDSVRHIRHSSSRRSP